MEDKFLNLLTKDVDKDPLKKYILFLLNADNNSPVFGTTKLMKELFLVSKNVPTLEEKADFEPDNYGPNSDAAANVLNELLMLGLVKKKNKRYEVSSEGKKILNQISKPTNDENLMITFMKKLLNDLTYYEFLTLIYFNYPQMTTESFVKEKIKSERQSNALSLLKKNKITKSKAAEIYGVPIRDFYKILQKNNIPIELM